MGQLDIHILYNQEKLLPHNIHKNKLKTNEPSICDRYKYKIIRGKYVSQCLLLQLR